MTVASSLLGPEWPGAPRFDPTDPALHADPASLYRWLRDEAPAARLADGAWVVSRHADVAALLRSRALSSAQVGGDPGGPAAALAENGRNLILASDPPVHTRRRGAVAHRFTARPVRDLRPAVEAHVAHLLDGVERAAATADEGQVDLAPAFCWQVPMDTLCTLLGLPPEDQPALRRWTTDMVDGIDPWADEAGAGRAGRALAELTAHVATALEGRRRHPEGDLLSTLATAGRLTADEQLHNAVLFLVAGLDTSGDLVANAVARLLEDGGAWAALAAAPERVAPAVVEEVARYDSPVQFAMRRAAEPVGVAGVTIPAGDPVLLALGAANRDPSVFPDADRFDPARDDRRHLAFGGGIHHCLGAPVARLEATVALRALAERYPALAPAGLAPWRPRLAFRGRATLPVTVR